MCARLFLAAAIVTTLLDSAAPAMLAQPVSFRLPLNTLVDQTPINGFAGLVTADFNGDGKPDLAYLEVLSVTFIATLYVSLGNGDGTLQSAYSMPVTAGALASGDFNGDGKPDLALWSLTNNQCVAVLLGNGDGTFGAAVETPYPSCSNGPPVENIAGKMFVADINRDGKLDIVAGAYEFLGNGDGTFRPYQVSDDQAQLVADFNGDGFLDIVHLDPTAASIAIGVGDVAISFGNGDGTFGPDVHYQLPIIPFGLAAGDFNGDGHTDLAVTTMATTTRLPPKSVAVLLGNGDGTFQPAVLSQGGEQRATPVLAADLNGDRKPDLVVGNSVLLGNGDGTFQPPVYLLEPPYSCTQQEYWEYCVVELAAAADLNSDGLLDLVLAYAQPIGLPPLNALTLSVLLNDSPGSGFFVPGVSAATYTTPVGFESIVTAFGTNLASTTRDCWQRDPADSSWRHPVARARQ